MATNAQAPAAGLTGKRPGRAAPAAASGTQKDLQWFRVVEDREVPRAGGNYLLRAGKEINDGGYDMRKLKRAGVKLEAIPAPDYWVMARRDEVDRLRAAGSDEEADKAEAIEVGARGARG